MAEELKDEAVSAETPAETPAEAPVEASPAPKKKKNKLAIVGIVVGVIVVLGIGMFVWHEQPSFCNAICHTPMDAYGATYLEGDVDKYGNELTEKESLAMMSVDHEKEAGTTCMGCHTPVLGEQISEASKWITGSYTIEGENKNGQALLEERSLDDLVEAQGLASGDQFCLKSGCHVNDDGSVMTREDLLAKTQSLSSDYNPHKAQHGDVACGQCHKGHSQSLNYCSQCHAEAPIPEGWQNFSQAQATAKEGVS